MALTGLRGIGKTRRRDRIRNKIIRKTLEFKIVSRVRRKESTTCKIKDRTRYREENYN
jgi:hypothetical protein